MVHLGARHAQRSGAFHDQQIASPAARAAGPLLDGRDDGLSSLNHAAL